MQMQAIMMINRSTHHFLLEADCQIALNPSPDPVLGRHSSAPTEHSRPRLLAQRGKLDKDSAGSVRQPLTNRIAGMANTRTICFSHQSPQLPTRSHIPAVGFLATKGGTKVPTSADNYSELLV